MAPRGPSQSAESTLRESGPPPKNKDEPDAGRQGSLSSSSLSSSSSSSSQLSLSSTGKRDGGGGETTAATRLSSGDSINGDSEGGKGNGKGAEDDDEEIEGLRSRAKRELKSLRCLVIAVMAAVGAAVSAGTYVFLSATEREKSDSFYAVFTDYMETETARHLDDLDEGMGKLSNTITATAAADDRQDFPYVTLDMFQIHASQAVDKGGFESVYYLPLVGEAELAGYAEYAANNQGWIEQSRQLAAAYGGATVEPAAYLNSSVPPTVYSRRDVDDQGHATYVPTKASPALPIWQMSPPPIDPANSINFDMMNVGWMNSLSLALAMTNGNVFSEVLDFKALSQLSLGPEQHQELHVKRNGNTTNTNFYTHPHSVVLYPVFARIDENGNDGVRPARAVAGVVAALFSWDRFVTAVLPVSVSGIYGVLTSEACHQSFTYRLDGRTATYLGPGDMHDARYDGSKTEIPYAHVSGGHGGDVGGHCEYSLFVYRSSEYSDASMTDTPAIYAVVVAVVFTLIILTFLAYDAFVQRRNFKVHNALVRSHAILASLFPSNVRAKLFAVEQGGAIPHAGAQAGSNKKQNLRGYLEDDGDGGEDDEEQLGYKGTPIADLYPETTVLFADIAGFTAWSSVREPSQVFTLLETLYRAFDEIAHRRRVFKVETIGDCYVAVTGLPDPRKDHAVAMCRFARDCLYRAQHLTKKLEVSLGPDTADLDLRIGLHSGPVTAGVLRGERSRFQLFGDTMNTASRVESTGQRGRIQLSQDTADLLATAGKQHWFIPREDKVVAKGKGEIQTFWLVDKDDDARSLEMSSRNGTSEVGDEAQEATARASLIKESEEIRMTRTASGKTTRLVEWNVEVLLRVLKQIVARRNYLLEMNRKRVADADESCIGADGKMVIDEVKEIIVLPEENFCDLVKDTESDIVLDEEVSDQLFDYVSNVAMMYNDNPFHNFEHASHVTMSVTKLLSRIVAPSDHEYNNEDGDDNLHDHTFGITSDPLTHFSCILSALIHDADHPGVPNAQLVKERTQLSEFYQNKSVAEQNSVDLAWNLLMQDEYKELRSTIYTTSAGLKRFRQLVVNSVMATDIVDKELKALRNARWEKAFSETSVPDDSPRDAINRKATIVIEHLIQASDVAHTMQHWHIYRKWNESFFVECYKAYKEGRAEKNPVDGWYQGEMGFYDFYIIPLAKKLKNCGVFGVSSDEYLNYALKNRKEWEQRGKEVVEEMVAKVDKMEWPTGR